MNARIAVAVLGLLACLFYFLNYGGSAERVRIVTAEQSEAGGETVVAGKAEADKEEEFRKITVSDRSYKNLIEYKCLRVRLDNCRSSEWSCRQPCRRIEVFSNFGSELIRVIPEEDENSIFYIQRCSDPTTFFCGDKNGTIYSCNHNPSRLAVHVMMSKSNSVVFAVVDRNDRTTVKQNVLRVFENSFLKAGPMNNLSRPQAVWQFTEHDDFYKWIHRLAPVLKAPPVNITVAPTCTQDRHGCCNPKKLKLDIKLADKAEEKFSVGTLILSSRATLMPRMESLMKWMRSKIIRPILNTDCFVEEAVDLLENIVIAWIVGPSLPPIFGDDKNGKAYRFNEHVLRATMAIHWMYSVMTKDWYICVDDDTLIFPLNLARLLSSLPKPAVKEYLVGHASEFDIKIKFHGNYPFGGSGLVVSGGLRRLWVKKFTSGNKQVETWLPSGQWNHPGGDGAICRLIDWSMRSSPSANHSYFIDVRGFHQYDIIGTKNMNKLLNKTCSTTPPTDVQAKLWFDDYISSQPVYTLHHIIKLEDGVLIPGLTSMQVIDRLYTAYDSPAVPPIVFLRRVCDTVKIRGTDFYFCINFGLSIQFFTPAIVLQTGGDLKSLTKLLHKTPGEESPFSYTCLEVVKGPQAALASTIYISSADDDYERYADPVHEKRSASEKIPFANAAEVHVRGDVAEIKFLYKGGVTDIATKITHLLNPGSISPQ